MISHTIPHGIFGGTFDPIHVGHIEPVREVVERTSLNAVSYIPASIPPHRPQPLAGRDQRLEMVRIALRREPGFEVEDMELARRGPSYTFDTIQLLHAKHPSRRFVLILGYDAFIDFDHWHRWQELLEKVHLLVMTRPGFEQAPRPGWLPHPGEGTAADGSQLEPASVSFLEVNPVPVSATDIRRRIRAGEDVRHLLPDGVWNYIRDHNLYEQAKHS